jgi:hypothetical protein
VEGREAPAEGKLVGRLPGMVVRGEAPKREWAWGQSPRVGGSRRGVGVGVRVVAGEDRT